MHHNHFTKKEWFAANNWQEDEGCYLDDCLFCLTDKEWFGSYMYNGRMYVRVYKFECDSNLDLYSIYMAGTDDYSLSYDVIGKDDFDKLYETIINSPCITEEMVEGFYFSN